MASLFSYFHGIFDWSSTRKLINQMKKLGGDLKKDAFGLILLTQLPDRFPLGPKFHSHDIAYVCKTARTIQEATKPIEGGLEYVTEMEG